MTGSTATAVGAMGISSGIVIDTQSTIVQLAQGF